DEVIELGVLKGHRSVHQILDDHDSIERIAEAHHRIYSRPRLGALAADPGVTGLLLASDLPLAQRIELCLAAVAAVRGSRLQHGLEDRLITIEALGLEDALFTRVESEPRHAFENYAHRFLGRALAIGILDPQQKSAAGVARVQPAEKRGADPADVQHAGGARSKSRNDRHRVNSSCHQGARMLPRPAAARSVTADLARDRSLRCRFALAQGRL